MLPWDSNPTEMESNTLKLGAMNDTYILQVRGIDESRTVPGTYEDNLSSCVLIIQT